MRGIRLRQGQAVRLETPGGGGYGLSRDRDPVTIAKDVRQELISPAQADKHYGNNWRASNHE